ncbi:hypothetical protein, partial [Brevibacillus sp. LEMMJ03]|uniref:hypothetical protein n=1 Tax=Brevibacillus sp. LEMMJ03 TaxID=2595056 RepID=UPI00163D6ED1
ASIAKEITERYRTVRLIEATVMEFETVAEPMYAISLLDTDKNIVAELTWMDGKVTHENRIALRTVFKAMEKYPERFGLK